MFLCDEDDDDKDEDFYVFGINNLIFNSVYYGFGVNVEVVGRGKFSHLRIHGWRKDIHKHTILVCAKEIELKFFLLQSWELD